MGAQVPGAGCRETDGTGGSCNPKVAGTVAYTSSQQPQNDEAVFYLLRFRSIQGPAALSAGTGSDREGGHAAGAESAEAAARGPAVGGWPDCGRPGDHVSQWPRPC